MKLTTNAVFALIFAALAVIAAPSFAEETDPDLLDEIMEVTEEMLRGTDSEKSSLGRRESVRVNNSFAPRDDIGYIRAVVVGVEAIYKTVQEEKKVCRIVHKEYISKGESSGQNRDDNQGKNYTGALIGGVVGGVVGNQVGKGSGKEAATAAGAILGAIVGDNMANKDKQQESPSTKIVRRPVKECSIQMVPKKMIAGYEVIYEYEGHRHSLEMEEQLQPGEYLRVNASGDVLL